MKNNIFFILILSTLVLMISCSEDFLVQEPVGSYSEGILSNKEGIDQLLIGAYTSLNGAMNAGLYTLSATPQGAILAEIHGGEGLKGSTQVDLGVLLEFHEYSVTPGNGFLQGAWTYFYDAVDRCNVVLKLLPSVQDMTAAQKTEIEAEARFLRGHYYFYLKRAFKNVPWVDETVTDVRVPNTDEAGNYINIWPQIASDFDFARKNLPETQTDLGRPNSWAAECYYAKVQIYRANEGEYANGYAEALTVLNDVMANGVNQSGEKYALQDNYYYNFSAAHDNSSESVFAVQHTTIDGSNYVYRGIGVNGNQEAVFFSSQAKTGPGLGTGWGFYQPSFWWADHFRVDGDGLPYLDMFETNPVRLKTDDGLASTDPYTPDTSPVDPRLDWSIGRRGIPFYDYGDMPGQDWIRSQADFGPYILKKWFVKKSEVGTYQAVGTAWNSINVCIIRYADVLLLAAECEARVGDLNNARDLVNQVRNRMVQNSDSPDNWVKLDDGVTNAANYSIGLYPTGGPSDPFQTIDAALNAILYERTLELGMEGHRFYDVVRFGMGEKEFNDMIEAELARFPWLAGSVYNDVPDRYLPIPTNAIDNSQKAGQPTLKQNPGY